MLLADRSNYDIVHVRKKIISIPCLEVGKYSTIYEGLILENYLHPELGWFMLH